MKIPQKKSKGFRASYDWYKHLADNILTQVPPTPDWAKDWIPPIDPRYSAEGVSAEDYFWANETYGHKATKELKCKEIKLLIALEQAKERHGITVEYAAEDFVGRLLFSKEIKESYPKWVANEIFAQAAKISMKQNGFVLTFIKNKRDFSELEQPIQQ